MWNKCSPPERLKTRKCTCRRESFVEQGFKRRLKRGKKFKGWDTFWLWMFASACNLVRGSSRLELTHCISGIFQRAKEDRGDIWVRMWIEIRGFGKFEQSGQLKSMTMQGMYWLSWSFVSALVEKKDHKNNLTDIRPLDVSKWTRLLQLCHRKSLGARTFYHRKNTKVIFQGKRISLLFVKPDQAWRPQKTLKENQFMKHLSPMSAERLDLQKHTLRFVLIISFQFTL